MLRRALEMLGLEMSHSLQALRSLNGAAASACLPWMDPQRCCWPPMAAATCLGVERFAHWLTLYWMRKSNEHQRNSMKFCKF